MCWAAIGALAASRKMSPASATRAGGGAVAGGSPGAWTTATIAASSACRGAGSRAPSLGMLKRLNHGRQVDLLIPPLDTADVYVMSLMDASWRRIVTTI